jgi:DNA adenine methylase
MDTFKVPLRYPGGKSALHKFIGSVLRQNDLVDGFYVEPFCGGAGLAIGLLMKEYVQHIYLNDADPHIFSFWKSLLNETEAFIKLTEDVEVSVKEWKLQKQIYDNPNGHTQLEVGFATFFLNRCNRSGIFGGRPIGGLNQTGPWKIDARFNKENLIRRIESISFYAERIHVYGSEARDFLNDIMPGLPKEKTLLYLDPPYYIMGGELYFNNYGHSDHQALSQFIQGLPFKWILSYDNVPQIKKMYKKRRVLDVNLFYRANKLKQGKELIIFSDNLHLPQIKGKAIKI